MSDAITTSIDPYRRDWPPRAGAAMHDLDFDDLLDTINPLQHLPVVSWIYREITGDKMSTVASLAGGALYGGVAGFAGAMATAAFQAIREAGSDDAVATLAPEPDTLALAHRAYRNTMSLVDDERL